MASPHKGHSPLHYCDTAIYENPLKTIKDFEKSRDQSYRDFIQKYKNNQTMPPIWKMAEIISFGCLSRSIRDLKDKSDIAKIYYLEQRDFTTILQRLVNIRNICAHHDSLWNLRKYNLNPNLKKSSRAAISKSSLNTAPSEQERLYNSLCFCAFLLRIIYSAADYSIWREKAKNIISRFPSFLAIATMGFPADWQNRPLWR